MNGHKPTYEELEAKLQETEALLNSIKSGKVDILPGEQQPLVIQLKSVQEEKDRLAAENKQLLCQWEKTFHAINSCIWILDKEQRILQTNNAVIKGVDFTGTNVIGKNCFKLVHITNSPIPECPHTCAKKSLKRESMELELNGTWVEVTVDPILDEKGQYEGTVHIITDISERKRVEEKLRESETSLERTQQIARLGSWTFDLQTKQLEWSDEVFRIFGCDPKEFKVTYDSFFGLVHPDDRPAIDEAYSGALKEKHDSFEIEHRIIRKDSGEVRFVHERCVYEFDNAGVIVKSFGMVQDITEYKHALKELISAKEKAEESETELKKQNDLFAILLDNLTQGVFMVDVPDGKPILANKAAKRMLGKGIMPDVNKFNIADVYSAYKMGTNELYPPDKMPILLGMSGITSYIDDMVIKHPDGNMVHLEIHGSPVKDNKDNIWASLVSFSDITERRQAGRELQESYEMLSLFIRNSPIFTYIKEVSPTESRVRWASENFIDMIGIPGSQMNGKIMEELFPPEFAQKITQDDWDVVSKGEIIKIDEYLNNRYYTTFKFPIKIGGKNILAGYTIDITERKHAEMQMSDQLNELLRWQDVMLEREGRVQELKHEVNGLCHALGRPIQYPSQEPSSENSVEANPEV